MPQHIMKNDENPHESQANQAKSHHRRSGQGIIHRDMKLENVLVAGERRATTSNLF